jgi:GNAT superfamily N-acetyltransferase
MCDEWMPALSLKLSWKQFHQLPRNSAYKYEYLNRRAYLSPRPKHYHALLSLSSFSAVPNPLGPASQTTYRLVQDEDWPALEPLFTASFGNIQPFGSLDEKELKQAARKSLERARSGGDGPWIPEASFVAEHEGRHAGVILITLLPPGDPCDWDSYYWRGPPPDDCIRQRLGRPHLTWVFVSPWLSGHGIGSTLLARSARALLDLGYNELLSTFMIGNDSSMLWHWRNGFQLLSYPGSLRSMYQRWSQHLTE